MKADIKIMITCCDNYSLHPVNVRVSACDKAELLKDVWKNTSLEEC